jgi:uridine kinase
MQMQLDGVRINAEAGQSLLDMVRQLGLDAECLSNRPLAAKMAGEVFNLNYIPVRGAVDLDPLTLRRAVQASGGVVELIRYTDPSGRDIYTRTSQFVLFLAIRQLWPNARAKMDCTVGNALYVEIRGAEDFDPIQLKERVGELVRQDIPLLRRRMHTDEAKALFLSEGQTDKATLLSWRKAPYFDLYTYEDFSDYYYGELAPSTGYLQVWDILPVEGGFMFLYPDDRDPEKVSGYEEMPKFLSVCAEGERWCELMECQTVADLNGLVESGKIRELVRVNEALHEKRYSQVADMVCSRGAKAVMLAGPSSSGKTTSANRLATQLRVHGKKPILLSLDDYYIDRDLIMPGPDGQLDLEHINTIDTALFKENLRALFAGDPVEIPVFNFKLGKREWRGHKLRLDERSVIIIEGLHALNPALLPEGLDANLVFKLYVSPLLPLNLDDHNRIPSSLLRLLRRTVRDYETRGASVQKTMAMWDSVRRGEKKWIFPYQEEADVIFNSSTLYELPVLKKHIYPLLTAIEPEERCYEQVRSLVKILNYVLDADIDDEIPPTSLVREFIGGNSFYR